MRHIMPEISLMHFSHAKFIQLASLVELASPTKFLNDFYLGYYIRRSFSNIS